MYITCLDMEGVLVPETSRLARGDTIDQGIVAQAFKLSGTLIVTPSKTYDPTQEADEEWMEFGLFMSRQEYRMIRRRMTAGMNAAKREGRFIGNVAPMKDASSATSRPMATSVLSWTAAAGLCVSCQSEPKSCA